MGSVDEIRIPDTWRPMEQFCYPRKGSKAWKHTETGANVHLVNMYDTGAYVVNGEDADGETFSETFYDYYDAVAEARGFMLKNT